VLNTILDCKDKVGPLKILELLIERGREYQIVIKYMILSVSPRFAFRLCPVLSPKPCLQYVQIIEICFQFLRIESIISSELLNRGLGRSASFFAKDCCQKNPEFGRKWWEVG